MTKINTAIGKLLIWQLTYAVTCFKKVVFYRDLLALPENIKSSRFIYIGMLIL